MKTNFIISIIIFLSLSAGLKSQTGRESVQNDIKQEKILYNTEKDRKTKMVYHYNSDGKCLRRIIYLKDIYGYWHCLHKHEYVYNDNKQLADIVYIKWDHKEKKWSTLSAHIVHIYDSVGKLIAVKRMQVDNEKIELISQK